VDALVDNLRRHGRGEDDRALGILFLDPEIGNGLGARELTEDVDVICRVSLDLTCIDICSDTMCKGKSNVQTNEKSSLVISKASLTTDTPALATRPVTGPNFSSISLNVALTLSWLPTSHCHACTLTLCSLAI
jgi:hypothetical protein